MSVLIVDDEEHTREVLKGFLSLLGHKQFFEAENGEKALAILEREKLRTELIVCDAEMPVMDGFAFAEEISKNSELDPIPFLLITSDIPKAKVDAYRRIDHHLVKPFQIDDLENAEIAAFQSRCRHRKTLVYFGASEPKLVGLIPNPKLSPWTGVMHTATLDDLKGALEQLGNLCGAVFVEPKLYSVCHTDWLNHFKKTPAGNRTVLVSLGMEPEAAVLRNCCDLFWKNVPNSLKEWKRLIESAAIRALMTRATHLLSVRFKSELQKNPKEALKLAKRLIDIDPSNAKSHDIFADAWFAQNKPAKAKEGLEASLSLDPFSPHGYLKLLELEDSKKAKAIAEQALRYCNGNSDVLFAVAKKYLSLKEKEKASQVLRRVLELSPNHKGANELAANLK